MMNPKNECIATKAFASLILDYEWDASGALPAEVSCRVLIEDLFDGYIRAESREKAIELFNEGARRS